MGMLLAPAACRQTVLPFKLAALHFAELLPLICQQGISTVKVSRAFVQLICDGMVPVTDRWLHLLY